MYFLLVTNHITTYVFLEEDNRQTFGESPREGDREVFFALLDDKILEIVPIDRPIRGSDRSSL
jgi:hypothetical protein